MNGLLPELDPVLKEMGTSAKKMEYLQFMLLTGKYQLDIIKLDAFLHKEHGYKESKHGSVADFIEMKWGKEACKIIERQLNVKK